MSSIPKGYWWVKIFVPVTGSSTFVFAMVQVKHIYLLQYTKRTVHVRGGRTLGPVRLLGKCSKCTRMKVKVIYLFSNILLVFDNVTRLKNCFLVDHKCT